MHSTKIILVTAITVLAGAISALAAPVNFNEVSLWVRAKETDKSILNEVKERKLVKALTPQQESTLKSQGASDSLVQSLRSSALVASSGEVAATETKAPSTKTAPALEPDREPAGDNLEVFDVTAGHPINLSQWGGPDYEFAFNIYRYAGENIIEPVMVDTVRTYTDVAHYVGVLGTGPRTALPYYHNRRLAPYLGGDLKDDSYMIGDYIAVSSHSNSRAMSIDRKHPVVFKGSPYTLYPVYGAGGTELYYIGHGSDSVKLAVRVAGR
ncbi:MAG TPA: hypothetical protein VH188_01220 [Chthoniobacterales bacterium]|jgi:hypothetical protein|nr:hypothetical protein [Chthoniobacterales bacterium]